MCSKQPTCFRRRDTALFPTSDGGMPLTGKRVFLNPGSVAVEECSQKGCLALSLLELLGFNLTFVFLASLLVLIEVRWCGFCLLADEVWDSSIFASGMSGNSISLGI